MNKTKHPFIKNVLTLMSGTAFAQLLSILASPLLSRIFTPEDFALQASFVSVTSLCLVFCSGKIEQAILLPEQNEDANDILKLSLWLCIIICCLLPFFIKITSLFNTAFEDLVNNKLIILTTIFILCSGICEILRVYFLRHKQFKAMSSRTVVSSIITVSLNLLCGYLMYSKKVLITSTTVAQIVVLFLFIILFIKIYKKIENCKFNFKLSNVKNVLKQYWQFPVFIMPGQVFNVFTTHIPVLLLSSYYSATEIGYYAFINKVINVPFSVIIGSLTQVFLQKFINTSKEQRLPLYLKTSFILFGIVIIPAVICVIIAPPLIRIVFGSIWEPSATIARVLAPMLVIRFALTPMEGAAATAQKKLWVSFLMQLLRFVSVLIAVILSIKLRFSFDLAIFTYSMGLALFYFAYYLWEIILLKKEKSQIVDKEITLE